MKEEEEEEKMKIQNSIESEGTCFSICDYSKMSIELYLSGRIQI